MKAFKNLFLSILVLISTSAFAAVLPPPAPPATAKVTLAWEMPPGSTATNVFIWVGNSSRTYTNKISVGNVSTHTVTGLARASTYFFTASAQGWVPGVGVEESTWSNEVTWTSPGVIPSPMLRATNAIVKMAVQSAPSPKGPWVDFVSYDTPLDVNKPYFFRSFVSIRPELPEALKQKLLQRPKAELPPIPGK